MNRSELVAAVFNHSRVNSTKSEIENIVNATIDTIMESVREDEDVTFVGFGTFSKSRRAARMGRNPKTGESLQIPETTIPRFKPGSEFKKMIQESHH